MKETHQRGLAATSLNLEAELETLEQSLSLYPSQKGNIEARMKVIKIIIAHENRMRSLHLIIKNMRKPSDIKSLEELYHSSDNEEEMEVLSMQISQESMHTCAKQRLKTLEFMLTLERNLRQRERLIDEIYDLKNQITIDESSK